MDPTDKNSKQIAVAVIPARYSSSRLPGKPLLKISGKPLILWVAERALAAHTVARVIIATDDARIFDAVTSAGFEAIMTSGDHASGTDRVAEVARALDTKIIVNVQGDEPLIEPETIDRAVNALSMNEEVLMATTSEPMTEAAEVLNPAVVKVVVDGDGYANSFSRNPIPWPNQAVTKHGSIEAALRNEPALLFSFRKHTGLYVYRRDFLLEFAGWPQAESERRESLEQLRALDRGVKIKVVEAASESIGVDTLEDLERVRAIVERQTRIAV
ncbi:MAG: 3-deoxy-manno-octulosonate cytidylyltransferase synthetase [Blastocatellia bacterium]|nr:3-deoxy-manno-octulosonate cytidylyltransferase synthetase [Blastocatellia bacterium]